MSELIEHGDAEHPDGDEENIPIFPQKERKRELTERQKELLRLTVTECGGDPVKAAKQLDYHDPYKAVKSVKDELIELAETVLARGSVKAALQLYDVMDSDKPIPGADAKIRAAQTILDRTNPKKEKHEHSGEVQMGLVILPPKGA